MTRRLLTDAQREALFQRIEQRIDAVLLDPEAPPRARAACRRAGLAVAELRESLRRP